MNEDHQMKQQEFLYQITVILISFSVSFAVSHLAYAPIYWSEMILGWGVALLNHLADELIKKISLRNEAKAAVYYFSGFNFLRFILLLAFVFYIATCLPIHTMAFIYALLGSYMVFNIGNVIHFYQLNRNTL